jgi:hypothetical protein
LPLEEICRVPRLSPDIAGWNTIWMAQSAPEASSSTQLLVAEKSIPEEMLWICTVEGDTFFTVTIPGELGVPTVCAPKFKACGVISTLAADACEWAD